MRISDWSSDVCSSDLVGVAPADQRLEALDPRCLRVDHRLVDEPELIAAQRRAQGELDPAPLFRLGVEGGFVEADVVAALVLGAIEGEIGIADKLLDRSEEHTSELQ